MLKYLATLCALAFFALAAAPATAADLAREEVTFVTSDGVTIAGWFVKGRENGPAVVLLHMLSGSRDDWAPIVDKYILPGTGFSCLAIDLRGHGESILKDGEAISHRSFGFPEFAAMVKDAEAAVDYLVSRGDVDRERIGVVGASLGANIALNHAAADERVKAVALLSPGMTYRGVATGDAMRAYGGRPVAIFAAREDQAAAEALVGLTPLSGGKKMTMMFSGNLHGTRMFGNYPVDEPLSTFLKDTLKGEDAR